MKQNSNSVETTLKLNIAEFLAEFFTNRVGGNVRFSYCLFWDAIMSRDCHESIKISADYLPKEDGSFYYEYGLLKAEEEMEADCEVEEKNINGTWAYKIHYKNPDEQPVSYYFYTKTRIAAFVQYDNEVMNLAAEMREITQQKPVLCLESHTRLFRSALDSIMEAYSKDYYSNEDLQREYCPDVTEVYTDWMRYKFRCSNEYEAYMLMVGDVEGNNVCNAIDAAWTWFHTGFVNNFISKDPETNLLHLNW